VTARVPSGVRRPSARVRFAAALEALPERDRLVLTLRLVEGLSTLEAAGALRMPTSEVEQRMASALRTLSDELASGRAVGRVA